MTDQAFDARLALAVRAYSDGGVRPIDAAAIATASMSQPSSVTGAWLRRMRTSTRLALVVALLILTIVATLFLANAGLDRRPPLPPFPGLGITGRLAYSVDGDIYIADRDGSHPILVANGADGSDGRPGFYDPIWSPDGRFVAYAGQVETFFIADATGRPVASGVGCCISWAPDSTAVVGLTGFPTTAGSRDPEAEGPAVVVVITGVDGTVRSRINLPGATLGNVVQAHWAPHGGSIVVSRVGGAPDGGRTWLIPTDGAAPRAFPIEPAYATGMMYSPDGSRVVGLADGRLVVAAADGTDARPLVPKVGQDEGVGGVSPWWSPDGRRIALVMGSDVAVVDLATGDTRRLWSQPARPDHNTSYAVYVTGWSAEGEYVLFETYDEENLGLWRVRVDGSDLRLLVAGQPAGGAWQFLPKP